jgi:hypothetical protein
MALAVLVLQVTVLLPHWHNMSYGIHVKIRTLAEPKDEVGPLMPDLLRCDGCRQKTVRYSNVNGSGIY